MVIGVNLINLYKLIKTINSNDTLTLFMEEGNMNFLGIRIENTEKNTRTTYKLSLLDLDRQELQIDPTAFNTVITLPSTDFMKLIRDMNNIADHVEIMNMNNQLIFNCKGDFCSQETVLSDSEAKIQSKEETDEIVQGVFSLKYLVHFTKCTNLCNTVFLYMRNNYPLICQYMVASLGEIKLCIAPQRA
jgi:proliferating cell nuclear antigen